MLKIHACRERGGELRDIYMHRCPRDTYMHTHMRGGGGQLCSEATGLAAAVTSDASTTFGFRSHLDVVYVCTWCMYVCVRVCVRDVSAYQLHIIWRWSERERGVCARAPCARERS